MNCPNCQSLVPDTDINVQKDIMVCRNCNKVFSLSQDVLGSTDYVASQQAQAQDKAALANFDITNPPDSKTWVRQTTHGIVFGASTRSSMAYFFLIFLLVFGGISTTVFTIFLLTGEMAVEIMLFFVPFFLVDLLMVGLFLFFFFGKIEITINRFDGEVFIGAFSFGRRKPFDVREVTSIEEGLSNVRVNNVRKKHIVMTTAMKTISFGSMLKDVRRRFIYLALKKYFSQLDRKLGR